MVVYVFWMCTYSNVRIIVSTIGGKTEVALMQGNKIFYINFRRCHNDLKDFIFESQYKLPQYGIFLKLF